MLTSTEGCIGLLLEEVQHVKKLVTSILPPAVGVSFVLAGSASPPRAYFVIMRSPFVFQVLEKISKR